jgi:hypothetical protein
MMTVAWAQVLSKFVRIPQGCKGLWLFLSVRAQAKGLVELEKVRNDGIKEVIDRLPGGAVLREGSPDGWTREIWMPGTPVPPQYLLRVEQLSPADQPELPAEPRQLDESDGASPQ